MSTKLTKKLTYDAPAEAVTAMLDDPAFREEVLERQKVVRGSVDIDGDVVTIEQVRSADDIPSFARKFVGDEIVIVQTETWTSPTSADIALAIPGKPGEAVGTLSSSSPAARPPRRSTSTSPSRSRWSAARSRSMIAGMIETRSTRSRRSAWSGSRSR